MSQVLFTLDGEYLYVILGFLLVTITYFIAMFGVMPVRHALFKPEVFNSFVQDHKKMTGITDTESA